MVVRRQAYLLHAFEDGSLIMCITFVGDALYIPLRLQTKRNKRLDFSPNDKTAVDFGEEQWLDPITIASADEHPGPRIIQTQCKFATQVAQE